MDIKRVMAINNFKAISGIKFCQEIIDFYPFVINYT